MQIQPSHTFLLIPSKDPRLPTITLIPFSTSTPSSQPRRPRNRWIKMLAPPLQPHSHQPQKSSLCLPRIRSTLPPRRHGTQISSTSIFRRTSRLMSLVLHRARGLSMKRSSKYRFQTSPWAMRQEQAFSDFRYFCACDAYSFPLCQQAFSTSLLAWGTSNRTPSDYVKLRMSFSDQLFRIFFRFMVCQIPILHKTWRL